MPIKVQCNSCGAGFKAKDELAGRRVKCPKCKQALTIPQPAQPQAVGAAAHNPLLDLLDQEDVRSVARGPVCDNCGVEVQPGTVICIECGFNLETGEKLRTQSTADDADFSSESTMTDAERIMAKAERDIDDMPITSDEQDFGDGSESYLIAGIAFGVGVILIGVGLVVILSMEQLNKVVSTAGISLVASVILYTVMGAWITAVAFRLSKVHAIICLISGFEWCIVFGFMQGKTLILPTVVLLISYIMMIATSYYVSYNGFWAAASG